MRKNNKCLYQCRKYPPLSIIVLVIFSSSNVLFFYFMYQYQNVPKIESQKNWPPQFTSLLQRNFKLYQNEWRLIQNSRILLPNTDDEFKCASLQRLRNKQFIATGWTKATYRGIIGDVAVAVKSVNLMGNDISSCRENNKDSLFNCYLKVATKLLIEIIRLHVLKHSNIIKILGYCVPENPDIDDDKQISIITELGNPIDVIKLLQMSFTDRVKLSVEIATLIRYLTDTPLGPVALNDFRRQQFVFVQNSLKLIDIDDIGTENPSCDTESCCMGPMHNKSSICVACQHRTCKGYNENLNIINAGKHFIKHVLPHSVPHRFVSAVEKINEAYRKASWGSSKILDETEKLLNSHENKMHIYKIV